MVRKIIERGRVMKVSQVALALTAGWLVLSSLASPVSAQNQDIEAKLAGLDERIEAGRQAWGVPGMAVAVVYQDQVIHAEGYGVLRQSESARANADTLFGVASTTKAMTAATLAMLVDEGKLDWDDKVIDYLPWFQRSEERRVGKECRS